MLAALTDHLRSDRDLDATACTNAVEALLDPTVSDDDKAAFLIALTLKGETPGELAAFVNELLPRAADPGIRGHFNGAPLFDCCGTGGGKLDLINVSTALMFILAADGVPVAKHGNRGVTKRSGSADVLAALGREPKPTDEPSIIPKELARCGMAFCFAPAFHHSFKIIAPLRQRLGQAGHRTIFNLLGPLLNPCVPDTQMIGVFREEFLPLFSQCLTLLGRRRHLVIFGTNHDGRPIGEASTLGPTRLIGVLDGDKIDLTLPPPEVDPRGDLGSFLVESAEQSAARLIAVFEGRNEKALSHLIAWNAGIALWVNGRVTSVADGVARAEILIQSGAVTEQLARWRSDNH